MKNSNELLVESISFFPRENDLDKYVLTITSQEGKNKFFIEINREEAEIILPYIRRLEGAEDDFFFCKKSSTRSMVFDFYKEALNNCKCLIDRVIISRGDYGSFGKIYCTKNIYSVGMLVGIIISLQFQKPLFITEESFLFNTNLLKNDVKKFKKVKNYSFKFSPLKNYSREFLLFLYENSKYQKDVELLYLLKRMLDEKNKTEIKEKDFF